MQQQPPQMMNIAPSFPPTAITTEQIQKYLDENKQLILAILENQNLGKLAECAQYQAQLQKNLIYLAAIADAQPPAPTVPPQMPIHHAMQQGHYMQHPQAAAAQQQPGVFGAKLPFQLSDQQQQQQQQHHLLHLQQQQPIQGLMGMRPIINNGMHQAMQTGLGALSGLMDVRGSKPDGSEVGSGDGQGKSASGHGSGNRDS
ncbi:GRF1-interacting factor 2-like [Vitis riparia]|uniref:GRF1-interacting factor 2-like n=1 Tax=Vitis riparia TaxID=96939 RepID=UPI00155A2101|nr:GRF1-interacting factor 2-like [Vitis riparia]